MESGSLDPSSENLREVLRAWHIVVCAGLGLRVSGTLKLHGRMCRLPIALLACQYGSLGRRIYYLGYHHLMLRTVL